MSSQSISKAVLDASLSLGTGDPVFNVYTLFEFCAELQCNMQSRFMTGLFLFLHYILTIVMHFIELYVMRK